MFEDYDFIWRSILMFIGAFALIRVIGRKSVAQTTVATTVVMIAVGAIIVQPIVVDTIPRTIIVIALFISTLILMEYLQMKFNFLEKILHGKSIVIIKDGEMQVNNIRKLRLTVDKIEMYLRQNGVTHISDIKTATIEPNGQLGYELIDDKKPLTLGDLKRLMGDKINPIEIDKPPNPDNNNNIFYEISNYVKDTEELR